MSFLSRDIYCRVLAGLVMLLICTQLTAQSSSNRVVIVKSSDNAYYNQTIETLQKHAGSPIEFDVLLADELNSSTSATLFIALGQTAVERVAVIAQDRPVINAYLTLEQYQQLGHERHPTVLLDQPISRYLAFSKFALQVDSIGIMTENRITLDREELDLLENLLLTTHQYEVNLESKLLPTLRDLLEQDDALLMLPRQSLYNHDSLKGVLMTSYRSRKPVVSYSPAHVRSGALASIYSSPVDIGRHLSILMNHKLQEGSIKGPDMQFARYYSIALNFSVASALGLALPSEKQLRKQLDGLGR